MISSGDFDSADPEQFRQALAGLVPKPPAVDALDSCFHADVRWAALPRLACFSLDSAAAHVVEEQGDDVLGINVPLIGEFEFRVGDNSYEIGPGECFLRQTREPFDMTVPPASSLLVFHLSGSLLESLADRLGQELRFGSAVSLRTREGRSFARDLQWSWEELKRGAPFLGSPLAVEEFEDCLSTSFATVAELTYRGEPASPIDSRSGWLVRAEEYLASRIAEPISLSEVANVVGVSTRTLSRGFHERHGMGAIAFLKRRRLDGVHQALLAADCENNSVTDLAMSYGFTHLSRFACDYRKIFGEHPSTTLDKQDRRPKSTRNASAAKDWRESDSA